MLPAAGLLLAGSAILAVRRRPWHGLLAASPALVAVPLALATPAAAFQLLAYGISAPLSLGALLAAAVPLPRRLPTPMLVIGALVAVPLVVLTSPFIGLLALIAAIVWWRLPPLPGAPMGTYHRR